MALGACESNDNDSNTLSNEVASNLEVATIVSVTSSGNENNFTFNVGISSPDTGCAQYADWWEVITEDGALLYRRILAHSHVNEQPFVRSGGTIPIGSNDTVIIRAHMNNSGYATAAYIGSVEDGFAATTLADNFAQNLATTAPLPDGCAF
jgi:hypothetical protein